MNAICIYPEEYSDAIKNSMEWKSSNEGVAKIEGDQVRLLSAGDAKITGTIFDGKSKSYVLHVFDDKSLIDFVEDPTEVVVNKEEFTINVGGHDQIIPTYQPGPVDPDSYISIEYELSEEGIIEVYYSQCLSFIGLKEGKVTVKLTITNYDTGRVFEKEILVNVKAKKKTIGGSTFISSSSKTKETIWSKVSDWALEEMKEAEKLDLIPETFKGKDFTTYITRADFAAVAVKLYEAVSKKKAELPKENPFEDTNDEYVLKAYSLGITKGVSENKFGNGTITREQMATMLYRALERAGYDFEIDLESVEKFADDNLMHEWSRRAIYFMASANIIKGVGNNIYDVRGNATIEQALAISKRSVEL